MFFVFFLNSQDTSLKAIKLLLIGGGKDIDIEENPLRKEEGLVFSSKEEEYFRIWKEEQRMCLSLISPER